MVRKARRIPQWVNWAAVLGWSGLIFALSSVPGSNVPGRFGSTAHFVEYAVMGALVFRALDSGAPSNKTIVLAILLTSAYGVTDELHQLFVPLRVADPIDWLVDTIGAAVGVLAYAWIARWWTERRSSGTNR